MQLLLLGRRIDVDASRLLPAVSRQIEWLWQDCAVAADSPQDDVIRLLPPEAGHECGPEDLVLGDQRLDHTYSVSQHLTWFAIRRAAGELLMFHAAGLVPFPAPGAAQPDGLPSPVVGIIAASGTGKTTFCQRLTDGFGYVTDETLAVRPRDMGVIAYPKPLSLIEDDPAVTGLARRKRDHAPADLGLTSIRPDTEAALAALVLAERVTEGNELVPISLAEALETAIAQSSSLYALKDPLRVLSQVLTLAGGPWLLRFSDQLECAELLRALVQPSNAPGPQWTHRPGRALKGDATGASELHVCERPPLQPEEALVRTPWDDGVESEGRVVLLFGRTPVTLGGAGAALWTALDEPATLAQLHDQVVAMMGEHPESRSMVARAAQELVARGVLQVAS